MPQGTAMPSTTVPATCGSGSWLALGVAAVPALGVGLTVPPGVADRPAGSPGVPPPSPSEQAVRATSDAPAPPRSRSRLVVCTPM
jgi:hypothetical protein